MSMRAVRVHNYGDASALRFESEVKKPTVGPKQVLVNVAHAGINYIDTYQRTGLYPVTFPSTLGREGAGVVSEVGAEVKRPDLKAGATVAFALAQGSYADYVAVDQDQLVSVPADLSLSDAAAIMLQGLTAHYLTHSTYPVKQGDWVLVHAGAGGTGALVIQMAKNRGAKVIATVSTSEKAELVKALGADHAILYSQVDFREEVMKLTEGKGVHVVYDGVGKSTWQGSMKSLRPLGILVLFGNASGPVPPIDPLELSKHGSLMLTRPTLKDYVATPDELQARCKDIFEMIQQKKLLVRVDSTFSLEDAVKAHERLESRQAAGKILLSVNPALGTQ